MPAVRSERTEELSPRTVEADRVLSDNPGKWECGLRSEGKTILVVGLGGIGTEVAKTIGGQA